MSSRWALPLICLLLVLSSCTGKAPGVTPYEVEILPIYPYNTPVPSKTLYSDEDIFVSTVEPVSPFISARYDWPLLKEETIFTRAGAVVEGTVLSKEEICIRPLHEPDSPGQYKTYITFLVDKVYAQKRSDLNKGSIIRILSPVYSRVWDEYAVDPQVNSDYIMILDLLSSMDDKGEKPQAYADYQIVNPVENIIERYQSGYLVNRAFTTLCEAGVRMDELLGLTGMEPYFFYESNYPLTPSSHPSPSNTYAKSLTIYYVEGSIMHEMLPRLAD